jgi:hypothetical protein
VSRVRVSGGVATARAGVRLGPARVLTLRRVDGQWRLVGAAAGADAGP